MDAFAAARVESYIPQRGSMRLVDRILEVDEHHAVAEVDVPFDGLFVRDGQVPGWIGIEYMAQTVSAWAGLRHRGKGSGPQPGLLLGSRRYEVHCAGFPSGKLLRVEARCEFIGSNGLGQFDCRILMDGEEVAVGRIAVLDPPDGTNLLELGGAP